MHFDSSSDDDSEPPINIKENAGAESKISHINNASILRKMREIDHETREYMSNCNKSIVTR